MLADFGLAKVVNRKKNEYRLTVDIRSLGCTVLEMLTRKFPYSHLEGGDTVPIPLMVAVFLQYGFLTTNVVVFPIHQIHYLGDINELKRQGEKETLFASIICHGRMKIGISLLRNLHQRLSIESLIVLLDAAKGCSIESTDLSKHKVDVVAISFPKKYTSIDEHSQLNAFITPRSNSYDATTYTSLQSMNNRLMSFTNMVLLELLK
ncbi:hypothetical protein Lser_V15G13974 [Lactuca serriola]